MSRNMTSSISTPQDPTQLPIVDIVHQTKLEEQSGPQWRPRDPLVMAWCEETGPRLNLKHRAVLKYIGEFVTRESGEAWIAQETIANALNTNRVTVNQVTRELKRLRLLSVRKEPQSDGRFPVNVYLLAGKTTGWLISEPQGQKSAIQTPTTRIAELEELLAAARHLLAENGIIEEIPGSVQDEKEEGGTSSNFNNILPSIPSQGSDRVKTPLHKREREERDGEGGSSNNSRSTSNSFNDNPPPISSQKGDRVKTSLHGYTAASPPSRQDPAIEIDVFVEQNWAELQRRGWKVKQGAKNTYRTDLEQYRSIKNELAAKPEGQSSPDVAKCPHCGHFYPAAKGPVCTPCSSRHQ